MREKERGEGVEEKGIERKRGEVKGNRKEEGGNGSRHRLGNTRKAWMTHKI